MFGSGGKDNSTANSEISLQLFICSGDDNTYPFTRMKADIR